MNSLAELIYREAQRLPENIAGEVYDFIRFVEQRHGIASNEAPPTDWRKFFARHGKIVENAEPIGREEIYAGRLR